MHYRHYNQKKNIVSISGQIVNITTYFRRAHSCLLLDILYLNRVLVSPILAVTLLINFPLIVYALSLLYFTSPLAIIKMALYCMLIFQHVFLYILYIICTVPTDALYPSAKLIFKSQLFGLQGHYFLHEKLKLMNYCELLYSKKKFGFTCGTLGNCSKTWFGELLYFYSTSLMFTLSFFI